MESHAARSLACALMVALGFITGAPIASAELPNPLSLQQALSHAEQHPRVLRPDSLPALPRSMPLFMACHSLAFPNRLAPETRQDGVDSPLLSPLAVQQLEILQHYLDVLLADLGYASDNEAMAVAFIQFDRARSRAELGQTSPVRVAELEAEFQQILRKRAASDAARRLTRARLAQAMGVEDSLPRNLQRPPSDASLFILAEDNSGPQSSSPDSPESLTARALANNPAIQSLLQQADEQQARGIRLALRQQATELLIRLELLEVIAGQTAVESRWRDLRLDESRTLYEMEAQADLGFSMSQQTRARRDEQQARFCKTLTQAQIAALQGDLLLQATESGNEPAKHSREPNHDE